jgi:GR25 family glycosyltransferase involved in LPS biosynthesis
MLEFKIMITLILIIILVSFIQITGSQHEQFKAITDIQNPSADEIFPTDEFDVYLINLDRNPERLNHFASQWKNSDMKTKEINRVPAVDGNNITISTYVSQRAFSEMNVITNAGYRTKHYQLTKGAVGCYLSHLKTYKFIAEGDKSYALILEDDIIIPKNFHKQIKGIVKNIPNKWDILLLSCHCITCKRKEMYSTVNKFFWLHCYIITKECAERLVKELGEKPIEQQIDAELGDMTVENNWPNIYCVTNSIASQSHGFKTDIQMPIRYNPSVNPHAPIKTI